MAHRKSMSQIRSKARREAARLQRKAERVSAQWEKELERRIAALTNNGTRPLTKTEIERLGREGARFIQRRMR